jgi:hypothetical protein
MATIITKNPMDIGDWDDIIAIQCEVSDSDIDTTLEEEALRRLADTPKYYYYTVDHPNKRLSTKIYYWAYDKFGRRWLYPKNRIGVMRQMLTTNNPDGSYSYYIEFGGRRRALLPIPDRGI